MSWLRRPALLLMFALLVDRPAGPAASATRAVDPTRVASVAGAPALTTLERDLTFDAARFGKSG